ncbi:hypothetical protein NMY22_g10714 [Coprinellus aureogranulatus]|nr:hypothetical protein NMY22_g10714 [Coprinellus aureogranulatus]
MYLRNHQLSKQSHRRQRRADKQRSDKTRAQIKSQLSRVLSKSNTVRVSRRLVVPYQLRAVPNRPARLMKAGPVRATRPFPPAPPLRLFTRPLRLIHESQHYPQSWWWSPFSRNSRLDGLFLHGSYRGTARSNSLRLAYDGHSLCLSHASVDVSPAVTPPALANATFVGHHQSMVHSPPQVQASIFGLPHASGGSHGTYAVPAPSFTYPRDVGPSRLQPPAFVPPPLPAPMDVSSSSDMSVEDDTCSSIHTMMSSTPTLVPNHEFVGPQSGSYLMPLERYNMLRGFFQQLYRHMSDEAFHAAMDNGAVPVSPLSQFLAPSLGIHCHAQIPPPLTHGKRTAVSYPLGNRSGHHGQCLGRSCHVMGKKRQRADSLDERLPPGPSRSSSRNIARTVNDSIIDIPSDSDSEGVPSGSRKKSKTATVSNSNRGPSTGKQRSNPSSSAKRRVVAPRLDKPREAVEAVIEITDSSDDESGAENAEPHQLRLREGPRDEKGKERGEGSRDVTGRTSTPRQGSSPRTWPCDLNKLDLEQLEAIVIAAKAEKHDPNANPSDATAPQTAVHGEAANVVPEDDGQLDADVLSDRDFPDLLEARLPYPRNERTREDREGPVEEHHAQEPDLALPAQATLPLAENMPLGDIALEQIEERAVTQILDIVPDANRDHVMVMVCGFLPAYGSNDIVNFVVQQLMETQALGREPLKNEEAQGGLEGRATGEELVASRTKGEEPVYAGDGADDTDETECVCCYERYRLGEMVYCTKGHPFCSRCLRLHAEHRLGAQNSDLICFDTSGCTGTFLISELRRVLPERLFALYERILQQKELKEANLEGLEYCPFCDWGCIMETPKELSPDMVCGNRDRCGTISCRLCRRKQHLGQSCLDVEWAERGRVTLEEAMTQALKRNCPRCQKAFIKAEGCNKMTCPDNACGALSCYVCKQEIQGYDHFWPSPTEPHRLVCPLYDDVNQRHEMDIREALAQHGHPFLQH